MQQVRFRSMNKAIEVVIVLPKVNADVGELLSREHYEEKEKNKRMFLKVLEGIRFLAQQGLLSKT